MQVEATDVVLDSNRVSMPRPSADAAWRSVSLPMVQRSTTSTLKVTWFRIRYAHDGRVPLGLVAPFIRGFQVEYLVRGERIESEWNWSLASGWNRPDVVTLAEDLTRAEGPVTVEVLMGVLWRHNVALAPVSIGERASVLQKATRVEFFRAGLPAAISIAFLIVGAFSLAYWLRRRKEISYLLFAAATAVWYLRTLHYWIEWIAVDEWLFWWVTVNSLAWLMLLVYAFALRLLQRRPGLPEAVLVGAGACIAFATLPGVSPDMMITSTVAYAGQAALGLAVTLLISRHGVALRDVEVGVLAGALWLNLGLGVHDLLLKEMRIDVEHVYLLPYGGVALFGAFMFAAQRRYRTAIETVERSNAQLEARVAERTEQLAEAFERLRGLERERAQADERARLMREMHDGLGSSLMSSLVMVEQGRMDLQAVSQVLRECVDDLRLTMDSMEPIQGDLATLLATLRYRLGRRLEAAGVSIDWQVGDLPALPWLDSSAALQVLRIVQEALTNVLKHAQARTIVVAAEATDDRVLVRVEDDGVGLPSEATGGRGLGNMRRRAADIGATLRLTATQPGTRVLLSLPTQRDRRGAA